MARRNVDLVISAKDEAEKVLSKITAALEEFSNASKGVGGSADKTESSLSQLGAAISTLEKSLGGLKIADKLGGELRQAEKELARLERAFVDGTQDAAKFENALYDVSKAAEKFARKQDGATNALARQKSAVRDAKTSQRELASSYTVAEKAQEKLASRQKELPALIATQNAALDKAKARYADLADRISAVVEPSNTLKNTFTNSAAAVDKQQAALNKLTTEYGEVGGKIRAAGSAMAIFGQQSEQAATNVTKQEKVLGQIADNLTSVKAQSSALGKEQTRLSGRVDKATSSLTRQEQSISKAEKNYVDLAVAAGKADGALAELAGRSLGKLTTELQGQRRATLEAKREYAKLSTEATRMATEIGKVGVPTREMAEAFARTKIAAGAAKTEYVEQRLALELMGRAYREAGTDIESINGKQAKFQKILSGTSSALTKNAAAAEKQQRALNDIYNASERASGGLSKVEREARSAASATDRAATSGGRLAAAYREFYGDSRRSLGLLQRIRGEVLSLVAAYGGLFAVIQTLKGTVDAYQKLEAAQARLSVATGGDTKLAAQELDFLRRTADRLGVSFGILATEYSKFSIATQNTRLEGEATRKIFTAVAEAARVNRSSTEEMAGVFTALTQIVSKGAVQMEELRQQLGDRLPGAIKLMADGLGVGTDELIKMMEQGEVTADALIPFADELTKRFGPGLTQALKSTSASFGRLSNEAFEAMLRFGEAGFLDAITDLVDTLVVTLKSADFQDFAARVSAAVGAVINVIAFAIEHFRVFTAVLAAFAGLKLTPIVLAIAAGMKDLGAAAVSAAAGVTATGAAATGAAGRMAVLATTITRVKAALIALLSTTGIGLLVAAIGAGIALWATAGTNATEVMIEHESIVDRVKNSYDAAGRKVEGFGKSIEKALSVTEARKNLRDLEETFKDTLDAFNKAENQQGGSFFTRFFGKNLGAGASKEFVREIDNLIDAANDGEISLVDLATEIDKIAEKYNDGSKANQRYAEALVAGAEGIKEQAEAIRRGQLVIKALTGTVEEQREALEELNGTLKDSAAANETAAEKAKKFDGALEEIAKKIPSLAAELEHLGEIEAIDKLTEQAIKLARNFGDVEKAMRLAAQAKGELDTKFNSRSAASFESEFVRNAAAGSGSRDEALVRSVTALAQQMGLAAEDLLTVISYETIGTLDPGIRGGTNNEHIGLIQFSEFNQKRYGVSQSSSVEDQVIAAGKYLADAGIKAGDGLKRIYAAINTGTPDGGGRTDENNGGAPGTSDEKVDNQMAGHRARAQGLLAAYGGVVKEVETLTAEQKKAADEAERQRESTQNRIADGQFEVSQQQLINQGKERQAAIEEAIREAKADNPNISAAELETIKQQTAAVFDLALAKKESVSASEAAKKAEEEVNNLLSQRAALVQQIEIAKKAGDTDQVDNLKLKVGEVNAELLAAIANAQAMWAAVGGGAADAAIAKLQVAKLETQTFGAEAQNAYLQWDKVAGLFIGGLSSAFDQFAQQVAEGKSVGEAARDAFLKFAADFLIKIAQMIIQQAIFNGLKAAFGGTSFGGLIGIGTGHTGGLVGSSRVGSGNGTRQVSPAMFAGARRYHSGGMIGLSPGEVPIIAKKGEEMLTQDDPRHMLNGGGKAGAATQRAMTIINTFDPAEAVERALSTPRGEEVLVNAVRAKRTEVKAALG